jgi:hypothetical protein
MNTQRVGLGFLSNCGRLLARFGRSFKSYILNDKAEQEWAEGARMEGLAELRAEQSRRRFGRDIHEQHHDQRRH